MFLGRVTNAYLRTEFGGQINYECYQYISSFHNFDQSPISENGSYQSIVDVDPDVVMLVQQDELLIRAFDDFDIDDEADMLMLMSTLTNI